MHFSISEIDDISDFQSISVKAKVMLIGESEVVNVKGKPLTKIDYIIADSTKSIKLLAWENKVVLEAEESYHIEGISVRSLMMRNIWLPQNTRQSIQYKSLLL